MASTKTYRARVVVIEDYPYKDRESALRNAGKIGELIRSHMGNHIFWLEAPVPDVVEIVKCECGFKDSSDDLDDGRCPWCGQVA